MYERPMAKIESSQEAGADRRFDSLLPDSSSDRGSLDGDSDPSDELACPECFHNEDSMGRPHICEAKD